MILNLREFIAKETPRWRRPEDLLGRMESDPGFRMGLEELKELHELYLRASADLERVATFAAAPDLRRYLESLVARAYGEIHETRGKSRRPAPFHWFFRTFPRTFRRHLNLFLLAVAVVLAGGGFGGYAVLADPYAKEALLPFPHLLLDPAERVAREESKGKGVHAGEEEDPLRGGKATFSAYLMTHNTRVSILLMAMGITWGAGTVVLLFYNGVVLGAVTADYVAAGQGEFLVGWLLPHGSVEIPAFLLAGQCGLLLGGTLMGRGSRKSLKARLRATGRDVTTLLGGAALLLAWAGLVEAFLSQYHEPVLPYSVKIGFGVAETVLLAGFLGFSGSGGGKPREGAPS